MSEGEEKFETTVEGIETSLNSEKIKNDEIIEKKNKEIEELEENLNDLKRITSEEKEKLQNDLNTKLEDLISENKKLKLKIEENDIKNKNLEDTRRAQINKMES